MNRTRENDNGHRTIGTVSSALKLSQSIAPHARLVYNRWLEAGAPSAAAHLLLHRTNQPATTFADSLDMDMGG